MVDDDDDTDPPGKPLTQQEYDYCCSLDVRARFTWLVRWGYATQSLFAEKVGLSAAHVSKLVTGKSALGAEAAEKVAKRLSRRDERITVTFLLQQPVPVSYPAPKPIPNSAIEDETTGARRSKRYRAIQGSPEMRAARFVLDLYGPLFERHVLRVRDVAYPALFFPTPSARQMDLDSVLSVRGDLRDIDGNAFVAREPSYRIRRDTAAGNPTRSVGGMNLCMADFRPDALLFRCMSGLYHDILDTCDALRDELLEWCVAHEHKKPELGNLRLRLALHAAHEYESDSVVLDGTRRAAGISVATLIVYRDPERDELTAMVRERSRTGVAVYPEVLHVIPAGMFNLRFGSRVEKGDVRRAIYAEFLEEIYGIPDDSFVDRRDLLDGHPILRRLSDELGARLYFTGVAIDLLALRAEICALLLIPDRRWLEQPIRINDEWKKAQEEVLQLRNPRRIPLSVTDEAILQDIRPDNSVPTGAAAFWKGIQLARVLAETNSPTES